MKYLLLALLMLSGCSTMGVPVQVDVPVMAPPPALPKIERPVLPIDQLVPGSDPGRVMRSYAATVMILQGYARQLEVILDGYRNDN